MLVQPTQTVWVHGSGCCIFPLRHTRAWNGLLLRSPCLTPLKPVALSDARTSVSPSLAAARSALRRAAQIHAWKKKL